MLETELFPVVKKHSKIGIASFVISIISAVSIFAIFGWAGYVEATQEGGVSENDPISVIIGLGLMVFLFALIVAFGLGIAGLFQKETHKVFAILGICISTGAIFVTIVLFIIGMTVE